jgi:hypothetical protein
VAGRSGVVTFALVSKEQVMYHCGICNVVSEPREARKVHVLKRTDGSIAQEVPVCQVCAGLLAEGARPPVGRPVPIVRPNNRG